MYWICLKCKYVKTSFDKVPAPNFSYNFKYNGI